MEGGDSQMVGEQLKMLEGKNLIKQMEPGKWVRKVLDEKTGLLPYYKYHTLLNRTLMA